MDDDQQHDVSGREELARRLSVWGTAHRSRDELIRSARDFDQEYFTHDRIARLMGLARPTVARILGQAFDPAALPEQLLSPNEDGTARFDLGKFEALLAENHRQAREQFWEEEAKDLPPGSRPVSWHATLFRPVWDTGNPDAGVTGMLNATHAVMRDQLPQPSLLRTMNVAQARKLGFGSGDDKMLVTVAVHYTLPDLSLAEQRARAEQLAAEQGWQATPVDDLGMTKAEWVSAQLHELVGHRVTITITVPQPYGQDEHMRSETGALFHGADGFTVQGEAPHFAVMDVHPASVVMIVDHGVGGQDG
ncbi:hypothetical protein [Nocardiopsis synnemataformans]|uniref:hypothetical protein n=1 Tax=Nocardiopsis synnemataformans TaxID=61305 RepID=UPI003EC0FE4A